MEPNKSFSDIMDYISEVSDEFPASAIHRLKEDEELRAALEGMVLVRASLTHPSGNQRYNQVLDEVESTLAGLLPVDTQFETSLAGRSGPEVPASGEATEQQTIQAVAKPAGGGPNRHNDVKPRGLFASFLRPLVFIPVAGAVAASLALVVYFWAPGPQDSASSDVVPTQDFSAALKVAKQEGTLLAGTRAMPPPPALGPTGFEGVHRQLAFVETMPGPGQALALDGSKDPRFGTAFRAGWQLALLSSGQWGAQPMRSRGTALASQFASTINAIGVLQRLSTEAPSVAYPLHGGGASLDDLCGALSDEANYLTVNRLLMTSFTESETLFLILGRLYAELVLLDANLQATDELLRRLEAIQDSLRAEGLAEQYAAPLESVVKSLEAGKPGEAGETALKEMERR